MKAFLRWFFGVSWILAGLGFMADSTIGAGILIALAGLFLLPPTFNYIARATGKPVSRPLKYAAVILPFFFSLSLFTSTSADQAAEKKKQEQLAYEKLSPAAKDSLKHVKAHEDSLAQAQQAAAAAMAAIKDRSEKVQNQFSAYDGSHHGIEQAIKERMNDPDSYEHVSTRFIDKGDFISVMTQFRGKNAFGGKVLNTAVAKVDFSGNVLTLEML